MTTIAISCIVEGQGEEEALPILVRRIALEVSPVLSVDVPLCLRMSKSKLRKPDELDQPALTSVFDLTLARRADSFDKCYREVTRLVRSLHSAIS